MCQSTPTQSVCNTRDTKLLQLHFIPIFFIVIIWIPFYHDLSLDGMENEHRKIPIELRLLMNF